jgi:hypothetical protein
VQPAGETGEARRRQRGRDHEHRGVDAVLRLGVHVVDAEGEAAVEHLHLEAGPQRVDAVGVAREPASGPVVDVGQRGVAAEGVAALAVVVVLVGVEGVGREPVARRVREVDRPGQRPHVQEAQEAVVVVVVQVADREAEARALDRRQGERALDPVALAVGEVRLPQQRVVLEAQRRRDRGDVLGRVAAEERFGPAGDVTTPGCAAIPQRLRSRPRPP